MRTVKTIPGITTMSALFDDTFICHVYVDNIKTIPGEFIISGLFTNMLSRHDATKSNKTKCHPHFTLTRIK